MVNRHVAVKGWLVGVLVVIAGTVAPAKATEEPEWAPVGTLGEVELRYYAPVVQARTPMAPGQGSSGVFRTLADYIFGGNSAGQEIAMTAPVEQTLAGEDTFMAFYMPDQMALDQLPDPNNDKVTLHAVPARTVAVVAFSGWARDGVVQDNIEVLMATLAEHDIEPRGEVALAQYNPPWTLPWLRRNEVMVEIPAQR